MPALFHFLTSWSVRNELVVYVAAAAWPTPRHGLPPVHTDSDAMSYNVRQTYADYGPSG